MFGLDSGAVLFDRESVSSDAPRKMVGSMIIIKAENIAAARELVEGDVYWTANVVSYSLANNLRCLKC